MEMNNETIWLIVGVAMIISEFLLVSGVGLLFAGIAGILVGAIMNFGGLNSEMWQWVAFLGFTVISALLLWKPMKNLGIKDKGTGFKDMVGHKVALITELAPGATGKVKWSGTVMNAKLENGVTANYDAGTELEIARIEGNVLILR
jgi:hypothetical protein